MIYKICYDIINPINKRTEAGTMATSHDWEQANILLRYYETQETNTEFYLVKEESFNE